LIYLAKLYI